MSFFGIDLAYLLSPVLTTIQIAVAIWLFTRALPRREGLCGRIIIVVAMVLAFVLSASRFGSRLSESPIVDLFPSFADLIFVSQFVTFLAVIVLCLVSVLIIYDTTVWVALFCVSSGYVMQNIASGLDGLLRVAFGSVGVDIESAWFAAIGMVGLCVVVYVMCYQLFVVVIERNGYEAVEGGSMLVVMLMVVIICIAFDLANKCALMSSEVPLRYVALYRAVHLAMCAFTLWMEFELLFNRHLERDMATMERIREDEARQYRLSRENIEAINVKCHDIRHQIRNLEERGAVVDKSVLDDLAHEVRIYDSKVKTGSDALDTILTEKSLVCEREGIRLTCVADGAALSFVSPADLYALFGNLLDNAIEAVRQLPDEGKRTISLVVRRTGEIVIVHEENYFVGEVDFVDGLPRTSKDDRSNHGFGTRSMRQIVERYGGALTMKARAGTFAVNMMIPVPMG